MMQAIVSSEWLKDNINDPDLILLDASQAGNKSGLTSDLENVQIKGARKFDLKNTFSDQQSDLPNTLPAPGAFEAECRKLGINKKSKIVVYDKRGIYTSPRVWWMFRTMGHENVSVLDGGLPDWVSKGYDTEPFQPQRFDTGDFEAMFKPELVTDRATIKNNLKTQDTLVIDARSKGRFDGTALEPRAGLKSGHIPQSVSLPFTEVLDNGKFKSTTELTKIFSDLEIDEKPLTFSCGSGITACIIMLASELVAENSKSVYDGSWTEWAQREEDLIEKT